jgi:C4-dicarboxylate-specific signal transduction histidine kinase
MTPVAARRCFDSTSGHDLLLGKHDIAAQQQLLSQQHEPVNVDKWSVCGQYSAAASMLINVPVVQLCTCRCGQL